MLKKWLDPTRRTLRHSGGCGYLLMVSFVASVLYALNSYLIRSIYQPISDLSPYILGNEKITHGIQIGVPVLMIMIQYWLFDYLVDRITLQERKPE